MSETKEVAQPPVHKAPAHTILKHPESTDSKRKKPSIRWDEPTIAEHDLLRGTRQKIEEPNTPYHHPGFYDSASEGSRSPGTPDSIKSKDSASEQGGGEQSQSEVLEAAKSKLLIDDEDMDVQSTKQATVVGSSGNASEGSDGFRQAMKKHYGGEFLKAKELLSKKWSDEEEEEEED